jgi:hypothetical protein
MPKPKGEPQPHEPSAGDRLTNTERMRVPVYGSARLSLCQ